VALRCTTDLFTVEIHKCPVIINRGEQQAFVADHDQLADLVCANVLASCQAAPQCDHPRLACVDGQCRADPCPATGCDGGSGAER
jgi:hypothetical protein